MNTSQALLIITVLACLFTMAEPAELIKKLLKGLHHLVNPHGGGHGKGHGGGHGAGFGGGHGGGGYGNQYGRNNFGGGPLASFFSFILLLLGSKL